MFEKFTSQNSETFKQRYEGTFGFFRNEKKGRMLARLDSVGDTTVRFSDERGAEFSLNIDAEKDVGFEFIPPKSNWYNSSDGFTYLVQRVAARQWQRGISAKNILIYRFEKNGALLGQRVDFARLSAIFNKKITPLEAVERMVKNEPLAISNQFALSHGGVYLYDSLVGKYSTQAGTYQIKLDEPDLWRTELNDAFRALSKTVEVS